MLIETMYGYFGKVDPRVSRQSSGMIAGTLCSVDAQTVLLARTTQHQPYLVGPCVYSQHVDVFASGGSCKGCRRHHLTGAREGGSAQP